MVPSNPNYAMILCVTVLVVCLSLILVDRFKPVEDLLQRLALTQAIEMNMQDQCLNVLLDFIDVLVFRSTSDLEVIHMSSGWYMYKADSVFLLRNTARKPKSSCKTMEAKVPWYPFSLTGYLLPVGSFGLTQ